MGEATEKTATPSTEAKLQAQEGTVSTAPIAEGPNLQQILSDLNKLFEGALGFSPQITSGDVIHDRDRDRLDLFMDDIPKAISFGGTFSKQAQDEVRDPKNIKSADLGVLLVKKIMVCMGCVVHRLVSGWCKGRHC
jgi:hypothetical protein